LTSDCAIVASALLIGRSVRGRHDRNLHVGLCLLPSIEHRSLRWLGGIALRWALLVAVCVALPSIALVASLTATPTDAIWRLGARVGLETLLLAVTALLACRSPWRPLLATSLSAVVVALWRLHLSFPWLNVRPIGSQFGSTSTASTADEGMRVIPWGGAEAAIALLATSLFLVWLGLSVPHSLRRSRIG
jgi:hypothetical protein